MSTNVTHFTKHMNKMIGDMATPEASIASLWETLTSSPWWKTILITIILIVVKKKKNRISYSNTPWYVEIMKLKHG